MKKVKPIPAEIDPLKLAKDSIGQKKRENRNRIAKLKRDTAKAEEELAKAEAAEKVIKGEQGLITQDAIDDLPPNVQAHLNSDDVIFRPNPGPQTEFLSSTEDQVFYGGARGGGKSYALLVDPLYHCDKKNHRALILRRTMPELRDLIAKSQTLYKAAFPGAKWRDQEKEWRFPSGARIEFGYAENMLDVLRYQGQSYTWIGVDELPQFATSDVWTFLSSSLRSVDPSIKPVMRACVDVGDVLTTTGWKPIQDVAVGDRVFGLTETGETVARLVTETFCYPVDEPLVRIRKKNLYASMTQDHRVVYKTYGQDKFKIARWNEHTGKSIDLARAGFSYNAEGYIPEVADFDPDTYAEFLGLFVAEGSTYNRGYHYKVIITQNKVENHEFVNRVMRASGLSVCYSRNGDFQITNKVLYHHLKPLGKAHQKHFPREFLDKASPKQLKLAFDAYALGDGNWQSENSVSLYTSSKQLADDLQEICAKLGYKSQYAFKQHDNPAWNDQYVIYVSLRCPITKVDKSGDGRNDVSLEPYKGNVYCITVDETNNFIIRQNGCVWVSGNTGNPGNIGSSWVKEMFIDPAPPNTRFTIDVKASTPRGVIETTISRKYIPATVFDNPFLTYDNSYISMLASLPEMQRRQFLEGDWTAFDGAAFSDFKASIHVYDPATFEIPPGWMRFRAADWGFTQPACCLWFAVDYDNNLYVYRELYTKGKNAEEFARLVNDLEYNEPIRYGVLDSSVWARRGDTGPSIAETMIRAGCKWRPADRSPGSRKAGKIEFHRRLALREYPDGEQRPSIMFSKNCVNTIRTLPLLPLDPNDPEDVDTKADDHAWDSVRYGIMSRPISQETPFDLNNLNRTNDFQMADKVFGY